MHSSLLFILLGITQSLSGASGLLKVKIAVILPNDDRRMFSIRRVSPALNYTLQKFVPQILPQCIVEVRYEDSKCDIAEAMNEAFNFYIQKEVNVFLGPCCDYAAAPVARQIKYWNLPLVTAGAMARDFGYQKISKNYDLLTRVGQNFLSLAEFLASILRHHRWTLFKQAYDRYGQSHVMDQLCYFAADGIHYGMDKQFKHDYFKFPGNWKMEDMEEKLKSEFGNYAGKCVSQFIAKL